MTSFSIYINVKKMRLYNVVDDFINDKKYTMTYRDGKIDVVNYSEIIDFSNFLISIRCDRDIYKIEGSNLVITKMMEKEILIEGNISQICFDKLG